MQTIEIRKTHEGYDLVLTIVKQRRVSTPSSNEFTETYEDCQIFDFPSLLELNEFINNELDIVVLNHSLKGRRKV